MSRLEWRKRLIVPANGNSQIKRIKPEVIGQKARFESLSRERSGRIRYTRERRTKSRARRRENRRLAFVHAFDQWLTMCKALAFRQKKQEEQRCAFRPHHLIFFPLGNGDEMEEVHFNLEQCGKVTPMVGSGYRIHFEKHQIAITRPNDITSLITQAQVRPVIYL